jgi:hypothetical protein
MDWLTSNGKIFGVDWVVFWTIIGWLGNAVFFSRFVVQWYATEKKNKSLCRPLLVAQSDGIASTAVVCAFLRQAPRDHLCLPVHVDSLHAEFNHPLSPPKSTLQLSGLRQELSAAIEFLSELRRAAGGDYFLGLGAVGAAADWGAMPYFLRIGWKSGCVLP